MCTKLFHATGTCQTLTYAIDGDHRLMRWSGHFPWQEFKGLQDGSYWRQRQDWDSTHTRTHRHAHTRTHTTTTHTPHTHTTTTTTYKKHTQQAGTPLVWQDWQDLTGYMNGTHIHREFDLQYALTLLPRCPGARAIILFLLFISSYFYILFLISITLD